MKRKFLPLIIGALGAISLTACNGSNGVFPGGKFVDESFSGTGEDISEYFAVNHVLHNLKVGDTQNVDISSFPGAYSTKNIKFASSNESVATVSNKGVIKAVKKGISDISVIKLDGTKDGTLLGKIRVVVSSKSDISGCATAINNIASVYNDEAYEKPSKVVRYEFSYEYYLREGEIDHGMDSYEVMGYDAENGYFFVEGPSLYRKTQGGVPEVADGKWIFYPISEGTYTRLIHITPRGKTFYDLNTASYQSFDRAIRDIINFFFVSGEKIFDNLLDDYEGIEDFTSASEESESNPYTLYNVNNSSLYFEVKETGSDEVVSADDELNYMDIPAGTVYSYNYSASAVNVLGRTAAQEIGITMNYKLNEENWSRTFFRSQLFEDDFEEVIFEDPADNGFTEVESMYDL